MKKTLLALLLGVSASASAVQNGTDVSNSDYKDYIVHIVTGSESCGGMLIGGQYLLTARHCIYDDDELSGDTIRIRQSITRLSSDYVDRGFTVLLDTEDDTIASGMADLSNTIYDNVVVNNYPNVTYLGGGSRNADDMKQDLVLVQLDEAVIQSTGALVKPLYDVDSGETLLNADTVVTFRGWGRDENDNSVSTMQEMAMQPAYNWIEARAEYGYNETLGVNTYSACVDGEDTVCSFLGEDTHIYYGLNSQMINSGDSGTPFVYDNAAYGFATSIYSSTNYAGRFTIFQLSMDDIRDAINQVVYPTDAGVEVESGDADSHDITIPVQNFTSRDVTFTPTVTDDTGLFDLDVTDCNDTISTEDDCVITGTFNAGGSEITSTQTVTIDMGDFEIEVSVTIEEDYSDLDDSDSTSTSTSGGGGSVGGFGLLALIGFAWMRRRIKFNNCYSGS